MRTITDYLGNEFDVVEVRDTKHSFAVYIGYSADQVKSAGPRRGRQVILTRELADYLEEHRRSKIGAIDLPIGGTAIKRLRSELGFNKYDDGQAWWAERIGDLSTLTLEAFAAKHGVKAGLVEYFRLRLVGKVATDPNWWKQEPARSALLSKRPAGVIAEELGVSVATVARGRAYLKAEASTAE